MRCLQLAIDPTATLAISETWEVFLSRISSMFTSMKCAFQAVLNFMFCFVIALAITEISVITFTNLPGRHHSECQFRPLHQAKLVHVAHTKSTRLAHRGPQPEKPRFWARKRLVLEPHVGSHVISKLTKQKHSLIANLKTSFYSSFRVEKMFRWC